MSSPNYNSPGMVGHCPLTPEDEERGYTITTWNGFPKFSCCKCAFDVLQDEGMIRFHITHVHVWLEAQERIARESRPAKALLYDSGGKVVERIPTDPANKVSGVSDFSFAPEPETPEMDLSDETLRKIVDELDKKGMIEHGADNDN